VEQLVKSLQVLSLHLEAVLQRRSNELYSVPVPHEGQLGSRHFPVRVSAGGYSSVAHDVLTSLYLRDKYVCTIFKDYQIFERCEDDIVTIQIVIE
jgi:hypothetical protein